MNRQQRVKDIEQRKLIAVVRLDREEDLIPAADAMLEGGVSVLELTMTSPGAIENISKMRKRYGEDVIVGVGSVTSGEVAQKAIDEGAQFVVSPLMKTELVEVSHRQDVPTAIGSYTPTEMQAAYEAGSDLIKVFPADQLGPGYMKAVRAPLPHLKLLPTGGVNADTINDWLKSGVSALAVGSALVDKKAVKDGNFHVLTEKAQVLSKAVKEFNG